MGRPATDCQLRRKFCVHLEISQTSLIVAVLSRYWDQVVAPATFLVPISIRQLLVAPDSHLAHRTASTGAFSKVIRKQNEYDRLPHLSTEMESFQLLHLQIRREQMEIACRFPNEQI